MSNVPAISKRQPQKLRQFDATSRAVPRSVGQPTLGISATVIDGGVMAPKQDSTHNKFRLAPKILLAQTWCDTGFAVRAIDNRPVSCHAAKCCLAPLRR
jgi:hypothetical protein